MQQIKVIKTINASKEKVWSAINNFQGVGSYHPYVKAVTLVSENNEGLNAERICHFYDGSNYTEKITSYEEGKSLEVSVLSGLPGMMAGNPFGTLSIEELNKDQTQITMEMNFKVKFGFLGKFMAITMIKPQFNKLMKNVLNGLDHHVRTGESVGKGGKALSIEQAALEQAKAPEILAAMT